QLAQHDVAAAIGLIVAAVDTDERRRRRRLGGRRGVDAGGEQQAQSDATHARAYRTARASILANKSARLEARASGEVADRNATGQPGCYARGATSSRARGRSAR